MQQLLTESVLLALRRRRGGLLLAVWGTSLLLPILPDDLRRIPLRPLDRIDIDASVLAFTWAVSLGERRAVRSCARVHVACGETSTRR